ncbi:hypothetical protein EK21DRAFT_109130 [Setomelanomma holmii]|uniref:Uncharacterized protein n=1 Tax=Setomelanomma holmii TaxID=210430 RepID=A0A9P4LPN0_9PLEO|nr:hypothetical protein EK21DRAFT_109130 [Setomelanomma holmii]
MATKVVEEAVAGVLLHIRRPAQCNGVFGLRISQSVFPSKGVVIVFSRFDVPGIFARDFSLLAEFAREWKVGKQYSKEQFDEGIRRLDIYKQWWLETILEMWSKDTVVVMQSEDVKPSYRDDAPPAYSIQPAWHQWWVSSILGAPEVVIPAGQIQYTARITGNTEYLPVMASLMSQPDSDLELLSLTHDFLTHSGRDTVVRSGPVMLEVSDEQGTPADRENMWGSASAIIM